MPKPPEGEAWAVSDEGREFVPLSAEAWGEAHASAGADSAGAGAATQIGDAASTVDPLSSQGLEKAFASAADAALTLDAVLANAHDAAAEDELRARRRAWERRLFRTHAARTLAYYARETRFGDRPFWRRRRDGARTTAITKSISMSAARRTASSRDGSGPA